MGPESAMTIFTTSGSTGVFPVESSVERMVFTPLSCPNGARTVCRPDHTLLVMNREADAYFRTPPLVHNFCSSFLGGSGRQGPGAWLWRRVWGFHHLFNSRNVAGTAVDSTLQVLLRLAPGYTFEPQPKTMELQNSPF